MQQSCHNPTTACSWSAQGDLSCSPSGTSGPSGPFGSSGTAPTCSVASTYCAPPPVPSSGTGLRYVGFDAYELDCKIKNAAINQGGVRIDPSGSF